MDGRTEDLLSDVITAVAPADAATAEPVQGDAQHAFDVRLDVFDGPLDLLLSLIKEQQLDIATVPLAAVAEQYLAYVRTMENLDVEIAAEYLVIAATLVFLKSKSLLPPIPHEFADETDETPEEVEERLRRRLIAYSRYRELGLELRARQDDASGFYYRDSGDSTTEVMQRYRIDPEKLKRAFIVMLGQARPEKREIVRERVSLIAQMDYISRKVKDKGEVMFSTLCHELGMTREVIIITFLAILELIRRNRVGCEQPELFDDIRLFSIPAQTLPEG
ncbi:MAG: segregation/condensation protein A [Candidatus Eremiobacteraeota bacterium]|nr:segregation/condensation protein A [Candidatus Eremiobacteraeota bacterium]